MKVIITGASRGIGYDTALELAAGRGHRVLALSRNAAGLRQLAEQSRAQAPGSHLQVLPFDLLEPDFTGLDAAILQLGGVDVVVNNAGLLVKNAFSDLTDSDWQRSFQVNFFGPVTLLRYLLPHLSRGERPHIVNIGSMGGFQGSAKFPGLAAYSAAKAALANLTECLAEEWKERGISVNCLALGSVNTEMLQEAFPGYEAPVSSPEMAAYIADFATAGHRFFNGKVLPVSVSTP